jgi:hypothetical protein
MNTVAAIQKWAVLPPGGVPDVSFVPPLLRRRLSPLQRIFFALAREVGAEDAGWIVFSSGGGEDTLTRRIVDDFQADGSVSPQRFSASVYNAAPGLWSVFAKNRAPYTAVAAAGDSIECGILEVLAEHGGDAVLVYAEEIGGGYGAAVRLGGGDAQDGVRCIRIQSGGEGGEEIGFDDFARFLAGEIRELHGRWLTVTEF